MTSYWSIAGVLVLVAFGASLVKPTVLGTVQKTSPGTMAAVGFSIYYMLVNVGGFLGPNLSGLVTGTLGLGVQRIFYSSTLAIIIALLLIIFMFKEPAKPAMAAGEAEERKTFGGVLRDFFTVISNGRMMLLFLWVTLYWSVFFQFYNAMPLYFTQDLGTTEQTFLFIVSLDALAIVCLQVVMGYLVRNINTIRAVTLGILVSSLGVISMSFFPAPWMVAVGILIFAVGEMTYAAHFYKYMGDLAPPDQVGMYMGFAFLPIALGGLLAGKMAVPVANFARETLGAAELMWLVFGSMGLVAAGGMALMALALKKKEAPAGSPPMAS
jgi:MFS family permease